MPNLNSRVISNLALPLPSRTIQDKIEEIVESFDDKIDLNRRMNQTLEAMARAIFKSWFVDFDLHPGSIKSLPPNWKMGSFLELVEVIGGGTPKTAVQEFWGGDIPWFSVADSPSDSDVVVVDTANNSATRLLPFGTTILSARGTVGNLALTGAPMAMNQSCYGLVGKGEYGPFFTYFSTKMLIDTLRQRTHGSVFDTITRDTLAGVQVVIPPAQLAAEFDRVAGPLLSRVLNNLHESRTLAALRDTLLPKLISGELRIGDAERFIGAAT
jgi:type I restriction enzyme S subunit